MPFTIKEIVVNLRLSALIGTAVLGLALTAVASTDNTPKLVGVWQVVKSEGVPPGASLEFTKDGKVKLSAKFGEKAFVIDGTYKVKDNKVDVALTYSGKSKNASATLQRPPAPE